LSERPGRSNCRKLRSRVAEKADMKVDEGDIVGGFAREYDAVMVEDVDTPILRAIASSTGLALSNSVTVEVTLEDGTSWSRVFKGEYCNWVSDCIFTTPNPRRLGVRVRGEMIVVDAANPDDAFELAVLPVECAASDVVGNRMFLADDLKVYAFDGERIGWMTRRVSLDGIRDLSYADGRVFGIARDVGVEVVPFTVDAETGDAAGGFEGWGFVDD
jgi:hypothetical protein